MFWHQSPVTISYNWSGPFFENSVEKNCTMKMCKLRDSMIWSYFQRESFLYIQCASRQDIFCIFRIMIWIIWSCSCIHCINHAWWFGTTTSLTRNWVTSIYYARSDCMFLQILCEHFPKMKAPTTRADFPPERLAEYHRMLTAADSKFMQARKCFRPVSFILEMLFRSSFYPNLSCTISSRKYF